MDDGKDQAAADDTALAEIMALMNRYFHAIYHGDLAALRRIFHPDNRLAGFRGPETRFSTTEEWLARVASRPGRDASDLRILSIDRAGRAGVAKIAYRYHGVDFTDYMSVLRTAEGWRIVAKVFDGALVAREP